MMRVMEGINTIRGFSLLCQKHQQIQPHLFSFNNQERYRQLIWGLIEAGIVTPLEIEMFACF